MTYKYCPHCGQPLTKSGQRNQHCEDCGNTIFHNVATAAGALIINDRNEVLLTRRSHEPFKGGFGILGGFVDPNETAQQAALREIHEEAGLTDVELLDLLGTFPDQYGVDGTYTLCLIFVGRLRSGTPQANDDAASLDWYPIDRLPREALSTGFRNVQEALRALQAWTNRPNGV